MSMIAKLNEFYDETAHKHPSPMRCETARSMMIAYADRWEKEDKTTRVRGIEVPFKIALPVPDDLPSWAKPTKPRYIGGIIDSILERDGRLLLMDLKTVKQLSDEYFKELYTNYQMTQYSLALYCAGYDKLSTEWSIIQKATIEPKKMTKPMIAELESGSYAGWPCDLEVPEDGQESPKLYGLRLLSWYFEKNDRFMRRTFERSESEMLQHIYFSHVLQSEIELSALKGGDLNLTYPANLFACKNFNSLCGFHPICSGFDPEKTGFKERTKRDGVGDLGLTPSKAGCWNLCRKKFMFQYVDRIEPAVAERTEALDLGSLCHAGLEILHAARLEDPIVLPIEGEEK
jgi:hypothetical protein